MRRLLLLVLPLLAAAPATAAEICNETSFVVETALGWQRGDSIVVEGWTRVRPGECVEDGPRIEPDSPFPLLLYARSSAAYLGGVREWRGDTPLCVGAGDFSAQGIDDCEALGLERRSFIVLRGADRQRAVLVEPADFGRNAQEAGVQRLLQAAGYDIRVIDGVAGRRTNQQIAAFVAASSLSATPARPQLIDALEAAAARRNAATGLSFCNETGAPVAIAIARRRLDEWESRGWWRLDAGVCARALAVSLETPDIFYYAETTGRSNLTLAQGTEAFCVAPSRFLAEGRDGCAERGYARGGFRRIPAPEAGSALVTLTAADFAARAP